VIRIRGDVAARVQTIWAASARRVAGVDVSTPVRSTVSTPSVSSDRLDRSSARAPSSVNAALLSSVLGPRSSSCMSRSARATSVPPMSRYRRSGTTTVADASRKYTTRDWKAVAKSPEAMISSLGGLLIRHCPSSRTRRMVYEYVGSSAPLDGTKARCSSRRPTGTAVTVTSDSSSCDDSVR
jgi:hypothetical protein